MSGRELAKQREIKKLEYDYKRHRRKMVSVRFSVTGNFQLPLFASRATTETGAPEAIEKKSEPTDHAVEQLRERFLEFGLSAAQVKRVLAKHDVANLQVGPLSSHRLQLRGEGIPMPVLPKILDL
jgi:hypothetical protein